VAAPPPGEIGSYILIPLSVIFFLMSIRRQEYLTTKSTKQHEGR
jgi:hypothetical protein